MLKIEDFNEIIIANWKLNGSSFFIKSYFDSIRFDFSIKEDKCVVICPPISYINQINFKNCIKGSQDCSQFTEGAYTGEISAKMLKDLNCKICIIGHSERRNFFDENTDIINKKLQNCFEFNIVPVFCIGENLKQKKENLTKEIIAEQIKKSIPDNADESNIIIAYEPIWAIGTGLTPNLDEIEETHKYIKKEVLNNDKIKILYGGSVKAKNYKEILNLSSVDGLLVGGASIDIDEFNQIIEF